MAQQAHPDRAGLSPGLVESIAGLSAGSVATLVVHPLDIVKTRMQIHRSTAAAPQAPLTTMALIRSMTQNDRPLASLYRGLIPNLTGNAFSWASFFFFKSRYERAIASYKGGAAETAAAPKEVLASHDFFLASALAGATTQVLTNPVWVIKTRMLSSDRAAEGAYPGMITGIRTLYATEGWRGFYRGLGVGLFGVSHGAVQFAVYEPAKKMYLRSRRGAAADTDAAAPVADPDKMTNEATIVISTTAKFVAGAVTYPLQVFRSRLQNYNADERFGRGIKGVTRQLWREEGVMGFYRGIIPGVVRVMPATWVTFLVYENVKYHLPRYFA
ncbi:mitochondrial carrier domain-containing protein [Plectosphaerella cucumerina]|uniref:Mitochondrial carrier domain-containing protein n=1 Tax=Plectosphaerella cucumerina TaxID=40658 RepID=A0A8K0X542_9PEZI|nr:mitochondrial carrier domain-containing protein [Plectosphaerella cucumerina]